MARLYHDIVERALHLHGSLGVTGELPLAPMWMRVPRSRWRMGRPRCTR